MLAESSALKRILRSIEENLSTEFAAYLLTLDFSPEDHARCEMLSMKAQKGQLSDGERAAPEDLLLANDVLTIIQSKARRSLRRRKQADEG